MDKQEFFTRLKAELKDPKGWRLGDGCIISVGVKRKVTVTITLGVRKGPGPVYHKIAFGGYSLEVPVMDLAEVTDLRDILLREQGERDFRDFSNQFPWSEEEV